MMEGFPPALKSFFPMKAKRGISPHRVENNASPAAGTGTGEWRKRILPEPPFPAPAAKRKLKNSGIHHREVGNYRDCSLRFMKKRFL